MKRSNIECIVEGGECIAESICKKVFADVASAQHLKSHDTREIGEIIKTNDGESCIECEGCENDSPQNLLVVHDNNTTVNTNTISINSPPQISMHSDSDDDILVDKTAKSAVSPSPPANPVVIVDDDVEASITQFADSNSAESNASQYTLSSELEPSSDPHSDNLSQSNEMTYEPTNASYINAISHKPEVCTIRSSVSAESVASDERYSILDSDNQDFEPIESGGYGHISSNFITSPIDISSEQKILPMSHVKTNQTHSVHVESDISGESDVEIVGDNAAENAPADVMYINSDPSMTHQTIDPDEPATITIPDSVEDKAECLVDIPRAGNSGAVANDAMLSNELVKPSWLRAGCFQGKTWKQVADMLGEIVRQATTESENLDILRQIIAKLNNPNGPIDIEELKTQIEMCLR